MANIAVILLIAMISLLIGIVVGAYCFRRSSAQPKRKQLSQWPSQWSSQWSAVPEQKQASQQLQDKLINLLGGDRAAAEKLVAKARFGRYGKSEAYYWWRAIQDLERQRQQKSN